MPTQPPKFDDKKHPRDQGQFSPKSTDGAQPQAKPNWTSPDPALNPGAGAAKQQLIQAAAAPSMRDPMKLQDMGRHSASGYAIARKALDAFHAGGISGVHHHGRAIQEAVRMVKEAGAKPHELAKLRHGLSMLHAGVMTGDSARVHEALTQIQHGFYHAHGAAAKEHGGMGGFPMIGAQAPAPEDSLHRMGRVLKGTWEDTVGTPGDRPWNKAIGAIPSPKEAIKGVGGMVKKIFAPGKKQEAAAGGGKFSDDESPDTLLPTLTAPAASPVTINFHTAPVTNGDPQAVERFRDTVVEAFKAQHPPAPVNITVPAPVIENKVKVEPTPINFSAAMPVVEVQVNPTPVHIDNKVEAIPGKVEVTADVKLPERKPLSVEFKTDKEGKLTGMESK